MKKLIIYTDGGARGNPGPAGIGVVIGDAFTHGAYIGETTNNIAEYQALVYALTHADKGADGVPLSEIDVEVRMDSELIIRQMKGEYRVKNEGLKPLYEEVKRMLPKFNSVSFVHVVRENNKKADEMVNKALDAHLG